MHARAAVLCPFFPLLNLKTNTSQGTIYVEVDCIVQVLMFFFSVL